MELSHKIWLSGRKERKIKAKFFGNVFIYRNSTTHNCLLCDREYQTDDVRIIFLQATTFFDVLIFGFLANLPNVSVGPSLGS